MEPVYYLHDFLWRITRATRDKAFGEWRVGFLLLMAEVNIALSLGAKLLRLFGESLPRTLLLPVVLVAYFMALNWYLFRPSRVAPYGAKFRSLPLGPRRVRDVIAGLAFVAALFSPLLVGRAA